MRILLIVTDTNGNTEGLTGYKLLKRYRNVPGEKTLSFIVAPTPDNAHSFHMVQEESLVEFDGETYRIKQMNEKPRGKTMVKEVNAIRKVFDLINSYKYETYTGSFTFDAALQFIFSGTGYTWTILDTFYAESWENFGDDNVIALFQEIVNRYGAEFTLADKQFTFKRKIGVATDFQFRYNYNIKTLNRSVKTNNLSTYIKGFGKDGLVVEYISPNAIKFINEDSTDGYYHAKPVRDERYSTEDGLLERLKKEIQDDPELSITIDFADMRRAGFPYDAPSEGDEVFLIYEPLELDVETRIMEIEEEFIEGQKYPIRTNVTLANFKKSITKDLINFKQTQKQVNKIIDPTGRVRYSVLAEAVKRATEMLLGSATELEYTENGIIARSKDNPNHLVLVSSSGVGVSVDNGQTFRQAITAEGIVADLITVGTMLFDRLQGGTLKLGGYSNVNGELVIVDGSGEDAIANFNDSGGYIQKLTVGELTNSEFARINFNNYSLYVDPLNGDDNNSGLNWSYPFKTIQAAVDSIPKINYGTVTIQIHYDNGRNCYGDILVMGLTGQGSIIIDLQHPSNTIQGLVLVVGCNNEVRIEEGIVNANQLSGTCVQVSRSPQVTILRTVIYGNDSCNVGVSSTGGSGVSCVEVKVWNVRLDALYTSYNSNMYVENCDGLGGSSGLVATRGGVIRGYGTAPAGTNQNVYESAGGDVASTFTFPSAPVPPTPPPPPETTKEWSASSSNNWNTTSNWWGNDGAKQGNYGYGRRAGFWFFGSDPSNTLTGKTIKSMSVYVKRASSGGIYDKAPIQIRWHGHTSQPGSPADETLSDEYATINLNVNEGGWASLPSSFFAHFKSGAAKGIGCYIASDASTDYAVMTSTCTLKVTYA